MESEDDSPKTLQILLVSDTGEEAGPPLDLPTTTTVTQLGLICNALLKNEEPTPFLFFANEEEIKDSLEKTLNLKTIDTENVVEIVYQPQAVFRVRPVTRCTSSMPGHAEAVVSLSFSSDGLHLASGSGDKTLRLWDLNTETPHFTCSGHTQPVLCISWAPDSSKIASSCQAGQIRVWNPDTGKQIGRPLIGHRKYIKCLSWEPYHENSDCRRIASAGADNDVRIWDVILSQCQMVLSGHSKAVTNVRWGGVGLMYTASQDRTIKVWRTSTGTLCRTLTGHGHWVNCLALSTDYVLRTGPFHPVTDKGKIHKRDSASKEELKVSALERFQTVCPDGVESFVSCSDDRTLYLWKSDRTKCITRMTGHQNVINEVKYSPDCKIIASASFDKSVRLWKAHDGGFICALRGHVQAVYQVAWSADSRLLVSGSKDSTIKIWSVQTKKLAQDLPGHADEVFAVDWAPDGSRVASGGKDKVIKMWAY
ncbi:Protein Notchless [Sergentomyia squamirostris]